MHNKIKKIKLLGTLSLTLILATFPFASCMAKEMAIHLEKNSGESADYNRSEIISAINKEHNKICLAVFYKDKNQKHVFFQKVIESSEGKLKVANWFEANFELISAIPQTIPRSERNRAVRPPFEFCIFYGESPWEGYRFSLWYKNKMDNQEFRNLYDIFINEGKDYK